MKQLILNAAVQLMLANGTTTTLEVKNKVRSEQCAVDPDFKLYQHQVSALMMEIADEEGWDVADGHHRTYSLPAMFDPAAYQSNTVPVHNPAGPAYIVSAPASTTQSTSLLDRSKGEEVCYVSGHPDKYVQSKTRVGIKALCYQTYHVTVPGMTHDNCNPITADNFEKKYAGRF